MVVVYPQKAQHGDVIGPVKGKIERLIETIMQDDKEYGPKQNIGNRQANVKQVVTPGRPIRRKALDEGGAVQFAPLLANVIEHPGQRQVLQR